MRNNRFKKPNSFISKDEQKRRKREGILIVVIIAIVAVLTFAESKIVHFGADIPISNTILMFILININLLLLILLIFLVFRNLVKLLYDRKRKVMGSKLRTRLVVAFIALTLLPTIVLFFFSINFITTSIEFWFNVPVEQALENPLLVGRNVYKQVLDPKNRSSLSHYIQVVQRAFNFHAVEVYNINSERTTFAIVRGPENEHLSLVSADNLQKEFESKKVISVFENINTGELIRTIGTVPFGVKHKDAEAFVVLNILIPSDLSENMASISRGFEEYQQIKLLKGPI
ncbi:MAG: PAS domain-containing sensor histidine kinase, partial [Deltaproteobacteria bacterium]|nr:PAS domain-containing sensor histidine kinase [Deltaproteobacteria bacterium]